MSIKLGDSGVKLLYRFEQILEAHEALSQAFHERTGGLLTRESDYTVSDLKRASRLLRMKGLSDSQLDTLLALKPGGPH